MTNPGANDYLMWVGVVYSRESYIEEATNKGACKRVPGVPSGLVVGQSRVFLISEADEETRQKHNKERIRRERIRYVMSRELKTTKTGIIPKITGPWPKTDPLVFCYFTINRLVYITAPGEDVPAKLKELGVEGYEYQEDKFGFIDDRECGSLKIGGLYLISEDSMEKVKELAESSMVSGSVHVFKKSIAYNGKRFRGFQSITHEVGEGLVSKGLMQYG